MTSLTRTTGPTRLLVAATGTISGRSLRVIAGVAVGLALALMLLGSPQARAAETFVPAFSFSGPGTDPGLVTSPGRVAVEPSSGNVFVADSGNGRVQVFDSSGGFVTEFGSDVLDAPFGIAVRDVLGETLVYVSDPATSQIVRFESDELLTPSFSVDGGFVSPLSGGAAGKLGSFRSPLAVDPASGDLLVGDAGKDVVQRYDASGAFLGDFDGTGSPDGVFSNLEDLAVDQSGDVFVVDSQGGPAADGNPSRVDRYGSTGAHGAVVRALAASGDGLVAVDAGSASVLVGDVRACFFCDGQPAIRVLDEASYAERATAPLPNTVQLTGLAVDATRGRLYGSVDDPCGGGCGHVGVQALEATELWTAAIDPPANVGQTTVELSGTVDPQGNTTTARFEVSTDAGASWQTTPDYTGDIAVCTIDDPPAEACTDPVAVNQSVTGLTQNTPYQVRLKALAANGTANVVSAVETFTTDAITPPAVTIEPATNITDTTADLAGSVDPQGHDASWRFETSTDNGNSWTAVDPDQDGDEQISGTETGPQPVTESLTGLQPNTTYQRRLVASNPGGETIQNATAFTTDAVGPTVATAVVGKLTHNSARLTAYVDPNNTQTTYRFEIADNPDFNNARTLPATGGGIAGAGGPDTIVYEDVAGLSPHTTYHWRVAVTSGAGSDQATAPRSFDTWPAPTPRGQGVGALGDRELELVSSPSTRSIITGADISADGNRALFSVFGGTDEGSFGSNSMVWAKRTSSGWTRRSAMPPRAEFPGYGDTSTLAASPDLEALSLMVKPSLGESGPSEVIRYEPETGQMRRGAILASNAEANYAPFVQASADQRRVVGALGGASNPGGQLVDLSEPSREVVGLLPDDSMPACGVGTIGTRSSTHLQMVSADGRYVFFTTRGNDCSGPDELYRRDMESGSTVNVSGAGLIGGPRDVQFIRGAPDSSWAVYLTAARQDASDGNDNPDVYRWSASGGSECMTCVVSDASVLGGFGSVPLGVVVSRGGERIYFSSRSALRPGASAGVPSVYVVDTVRRALDYVAPATLVSSSFYAQDATASVGGSVLVFTSSSPVLNDLTGTNNGGGIQRYRYDGRDESLTCMSCLSVGTSLGVSGEKLAGDADVYLTYKLAPLSEDGRTFVFETPTALVAKDVNGVGDVYEWRDGRVGLISDGTRPGSGRPLFSMSSDGSSVLFRSVLALTGDAAAAGQKLYSARVGGGFDPVLPSVGCVGDGCQGQGGLAGRSVVGSPASGGFAGAGDVRVRRRVSCSGLRARVLGARRAVRRAEGARRRVVATRKWRKAKRKLVVCRRGARS